MLSVQGGAISSKTRRQPTVALSSVMKLLIYLVDLNIYFRS